MSTEDKNISIADPNFNEHSCGLAGGMSWHGVVELLRRHELVHPDENVSGFRVNDQGFNYYIEKKR